ncbi:hypothetical protein Sme01_44350 [Sphaerisporangium melleum]|uniref:DUF397 domain-containing protein n=1 Tax=Sphaerisporangium melleum TaxID=321316 RepID=A0A917VH60_9ACTN|nr:DUF397 domain-containing protein [Sphaerisporangium melleum]GGK81147.1 hypothetical protein GCM10007964_24760 [Sphaerisporangium melleum]GII71959.1 hypothetical protein Sme01_44350 [Sphaerisporangium melleum]
MIESGPSHTVWRKSSLSGSNNNCVEMAFLGTAVVAVRDSKLPEGGVTLFSPAAWQAFVDGIKQGEIRSV